MALRLRRGTDAERLLIVPAAGELIYTTDTKKVYVGDGATEGGLPIDTGALSINELTDVNTTQGDSTQPANGEALVWDSNNQEWRPGVVAGGGGGASNLIDLNDVSVSGLAAEQILVWDGANFVNQTPAYDLEDEAFPTLGGPLNASGENISNVNILSATTFQGSGSQLTDINISADTTPTLGGPLNANNNNITGVNNIVANTFTGDGSAITNVPFNLINDTTPQLGGTLDANNNSITGVQNIACQTISGNGAGLFGLDISTDGTPELGGNLNLAGNNITGTGTIQVTGNMQCDVFVSNVASSRFFGDLTGSIFADDSAVFYDSINHTLSVDTSTTTNLITSNITALNGSIINLGTTAQPTQLQLNWQGDDAGPIMDIYSTTDSFPEMAWHTSGGTLLSPTVVAPEDGLGDTSYYGWDGTDWALGAVVSVAVTGSPAGGSVPSSYNIAMFQNGGVSATLSLSADGVLSVPAITSDLNGSVFADNSTLLVDAVNGTIPGYISITQLQSIVASAGTYGDFQTAIAAL